MQLFVSDQYHISWSQLTIQEPRIIQQCLRVLRMKSWHTLALQDKLTRYTLEIIDYSSSALETSIINTQTLTKPKSTSMYVALPNRRSKAELIVQKLSEIGVSDIVFRPAQRSILRDLPDKRLDRLQSIALEATEQSRNPQMPALSFVANLDKTRMIWVDFLIMAHQEGSSLESLLSLEQRSVSQCGALIGPEWGYSPQELALWWSHSHSLNLGESILRTETAAIVMGWIIRHYF